MTPHEDDEKDWIFGLWNEGSNCYYEKYEWAYP